MDASQIEKAVTTRARVRISKNNGWAAGVEGIAMGYRATYDNIKVGFVDAEGNYTGEYTMVPRSSVELIGEPEDAEQEDTVTVYGINSDTPVRHLSTIEAQDAAVMNFRHGATIHEYDTTDRNGAPLHVVIAATADQGTVYEFPETPATVPTASSPQAAAPERQITSPAPTGAYAAALKVCRAKGYAHAPNDARMAGLCEDVVQALVGAVSPQLVWEGATEKGLTAKQLLDLCHTDFMAVDDLQWI